MDVISSGSPRPKFTLTPRHEVQYLSGLAPPPSRAIVASFRAGGMSGLGAEPAPETGFPTFPIVVYAALAGLIFGTVQGRKGRR